MSNLSSAFAQADTHHAAETDEGNDTALPKPVSFNKRTTMKRVSFYIPEALYDDIQEFADERGDSMTGVLRWSLGVGKAIWDQIKAGHRIQAVPGPRSEVSTERDLVFTR